MKKENKQKKWRKRLAVLGFILLNVAVIAWTAMSEFGGGEEATDFSDVKLIWWMLIPAALCFVVATGAEIYKYYMVMRDTWVGKRKFQPKEAWRISKNTVLLGRYYDNITPAAVGGQPFQIYYMNKNGIEGGFGTVIPLIGMITDQLAFLIIGMLAIVVGSFAGWISNTAIVAAGWIGLLCYAFFPVMILAATFLPRATDEIMGFGIKFLAKIRIIKDAEGALKTARKSVAQYADCIKTILGQKDTFWKALLLGMVNYVGMLMIPFFVLMMFGAKVNFLTSFTTMAAVSAAVYFIPTPGNAGAAEGVFYSVFSVLPESGYVFWAMLFWRFFAYYLFLILGLITQFQVYAKDKKILSGWKKDKAKMEDKAEQRVRELEGE